MRILFLLLVLSGSLSSCMRVLGHAVGFNKKEAALETLNVPGKKVYFLGMAHLGKPGFYQDVKRIVTGLQADGFVCYVEGVKAPDSNRVPVDTLAFRKLRKLLGVDLSRRYSDGSHPFLAKFAKRNKLVDQPSYAELGVRDFRWTDYAYTDLIRIEEFKRGEVVLDSCDLATPVGKTSDCVRLRTERGRVFVKDVVMQERNRLIANRVLTSADQKILIIYGRGHLKGVRQELDLAARKK